MNEAQLIKKINNLNMWSRGDERAPHKPLLVLYALSQVDQRKARLIPYDQVKKNLTQLLSAFGPPRKTIRTNCPFVRLVNDGIWELNQAFNTKKDISDSKLLLSNAAGGFSEDIYITLLNDRKLIRTIAYMLIEQNFPESMHEDILRMVGLDTSIIIRKPRDPEFRDRVLRAYEYQCAVCGFNVRLGDRLIAVEAAHIKWYQAGGPDQEDNGIALCSMHHKLFDRGAFTLNTSLELQIAQVAYGTSGFDEWLMRFHGKALRQPQSPYYRPAHPFIKWHNREVFSGPARVCNC